MVAQFHPDLSVVAADPRPILIVEDDPALAALLTRYCQRLGFAPRCAATAEAARQHWAANPVDLAIVDLTLPDATGETLALDWLQERDRLQVVLTSGYPASVEALLPEPLRHRARFLQKPFLPADLEAQLRGAGET